MLEEVVAAQDSSSSHAIHSTVIFREDYLSTYGCLLIE